MADIPLTCQHLVELVTEYLEGMLVPEDRARFEAHLAICPPCDIYLEQMRRTIDLTGQLRETDIEPPARERLLDLFRQWKSS
ncbi:MAG TPA: zf-HC2 domain-containing protein [Chloroflexota bacterium]|nr:zf-HC2 domain-containing protein [Chloroflexota bacterium]